MSQTRSSHTSRRRAISVALLSASILAGLASIEWAIAWLQPITKAYRWDSATDYRLRPNLDLRFDTDEFSTRIRTNGQGLRDPAWQDNESRPVVLLVGDSLVFGHGVEQADSFAVGLQNILGNGVRVVNSGHPGWDTRRELAWLRAEGLRYRPRVVVVGFVLNDVLSNSGEFRFSPTAGGWLRYLPFPAISTTFQYLLNDPKFLFFRLGFGVPYGSVDHIGCLRVGQCEAGWRATADLIRQLSAEVRSMGANLVLAHLPTRPEAEIDPALTHYQHDLAARKLEAIAGQEGIRFLSIPGLGTSSFFPRDGHWTPMGHRNAARALAPVVAESLDGRL